MIQLIAPEFHSAFSDDIQAVQRLRYRVFKERLDWDVATENDLESDSFDALRPHYLLLRGDLGTVDGCVRLLPSTGPTMLRDIFPSLLDGSEAPSQSDIWESSRFALDQAAASSVGAGGLAEGTYKLFAGMIEFGVALGLKSIVTVTDVRMERILRRAGWPLDRLGEPKEIGKTRAVAGLLSISGESLDAIRRTGGFDRPVLWAPVIGAVA